MQNIFIVSIFFSKIVFMQHMYKTHTIIIQSVIVDSIIGYSILKCFLKSCYWDKAEIQVHTEVCLHCSYSVICNNICTVPQHTQTISCSFWQKSKKLKSCRALGKAMLVCWSRLKVLHRHAWSTERESSGLLSSSESPRATLSHWNDVYTVFCQVHCGGNVNTDWIKIRDNFVFFFFSF